MLKSKLVLFCSIVVITIFSLAIQVNASNQKLSVSSVTVSSSQSGYDPSKAIDGTYSDANNKWAANAAPTTANPQWIKFDLGSVKYVGTIDIYPNIGYGPQNFTIETSQDDTTYSVQKTVSLTSDKQGYYYWTPLKARYLRIKATAGFNSASQIKEVYICSDILPHRVAELSAGDLYGFSLSTEAGFSALNNANVQLVNPVVCGYAPNYTVQILPNGGDPGVDANYNWTNVDAMVNRFANHGIDTFMSQCLGKLDTYWPQLVTNMVSEDGDTFSDSCKPNPFVDDALTLSKTLAQKVAQHFNSNPYVRLEALGGPGYFGGMEIFGGFDPIINPKLWVYDNNAKAKFRAWLQTKYASINTLNTAWGTGYATWNDVQPPYPQRTNMPGAYDTRQNWSDLMFWMRDFLTNWAQQYAGSVRSATDKPIYLEVDGTNLFCQMEGQACVGLMARMINNYKPAVLACSMSDDLCGISMLAAADRLYGYDSAMDNASYESKKMSDDTFFGLLAKGIGTFNHSNMAMLFDGCGWNGTGTGWDPSGTYTGTTAYNQLAQRTGSLLAVDPLPDQCDVAMYNSFYSTNYRKGYSYSDYINVFDKDHGLGWTVRPFASWAHYLDTPDILDDFLIEDGALANYKLLVTSNMSLTLTSDTAVTNLKNWVSGGKAIVGFGKDSFDYKLNLATRSISGDTNVSSWMMGISGGSAAATTTSRIAVVPSNKPSWLTSLKTGETASFQVTDSCQAQAFTSLLSGATPVLVDGNGNTIMCEYSYGSGKVLFCTIPVSDSEMFYDGFMGKILSDFADHVGVVRKVKYDGDKYHVAYMGTNKKDDTKVIVVADPKYMADGQFQSNGQMAEPEYIANGQTLSIQTDSSLNGSQVGVYLTAPWNNISGGNIKETSLDLPQKIITYTASSSQPLILHALPYGSLPVTNVTAGMYEKPFLAKNIADSSKFDTGMWKGGSATTNNPQTITADFGATYPVSGMELYPYTDYDENEIFSFEIGRYDGWTVTTGTAFGTAPSTSKHSGQVTGIKGMYWADSQWGGESATGTLRSNNFLIDKDFLTLKVNGFDGVSGQNNQNYVYIRRASDNAIIYSCKPPQSNVFTMVCCELEGSRGTEAYIEVVDNDSDAAFAWLGIDDVCLCSYKEDKDIPDFSFEQGVWAGWTTTGTAFGSAPSTSDNGGYVKGWRGTYWANSKNAGSETATGTLKSPNFIPGKELLTFRILGYDGASGTANQNYVYLKKTSDNSILCSVKPPQSDTFTDITWDVTQYMGMSVYIQVVDNCTASGCAWLGIDNVCFSSNYGFERGTYSDWTTTGTAFGTAPSYQKIDPTVTAFFGTLEKKQIPPIAGYDGKYYATTRIEGESAVGTLTSKNFVIQKPVLFFRKAGYDGVSGTSNQNYYYLKRASDNAVLMSCKPPQNDNYVQAYWDVSGYIGTEVYFQVVDNNSDSGYAWLAFDDLYQGFNFNFEIGTWAGWTTTGTAFGSTPRNLGHGSVAKYRGTYFGDSYNGGETATGTLTSNNFFLENKTFSFRKAGYDGQNGTNNQNYYYLKRASDGVILFSAKPSQSDAFVTQTWDVSAYLGTKVYFQVVDGCPDSSYAWLAVDDINWRGAGPRSFTVQTSTDNINWSSAVLTVTDQGNKYDSYSWMSTNARYVKLNITDGYSNKVMIKELTFKKDLTQLTVSSATASSYNTGYEPGKAIDGITESDTNMWVCTGAPPAWIQLDLGSAQNISCVEVFARNNTLAQKLGPKDFTIKVSTNGTTWTTVYTAKNNGENDVMYTFPTISARYVKLDITSGWNSMAQVREVKVFQ